MSAKADHFDLTEARVNAGYSIRGLAKELHIAAPTLVRLEGRQGVHPAIAKKVADFFGVKVTDLMPVASDSPRRAA